MRMLDEVFQLDYQLGELGPRVELDEELHVMTCARRMYDDEEQAYYDVVGVGVFTSRGEIVGLVPEGLEQAARDAMGSGIRAVVIDNFYLPPRVRMTDEEARKKAREEEERRTKISHWRQTALFAIPSLIFLVLFAAAIAALLSVWGLGLYSIV